MQDTIIPARHPGRDTLGHRIPHVEPIIEKPIRGTVWQDTGRAILVLGALGRGPRTGFVLISLALQAVRR